MSMTAAQHQKQLDDAEEIDLAAERWEQYARESLEAMGECEYLIKWQWSAVPKKKTAFDVLGAAFRDSSDEFELAFSQIDKGPDEALRLFREIRDKAVDEVVSDIDFHKAAELAAEQEKDEAA